MDHVYCYIYTTFRLDLTVDIARVLYVKLKTLEGFRDSNLLF